MADGQAPRAHDTHFRPSLLIGAEGGAGASDLMLDAHEPSPKNRGLQAQLEKDLLDLKDARLAVVTSAKGEKAPLFTSVPEPMDARHFARQRETILGRVMHIASPDPVAVHADALKDEVELCMHPIHTSANFPVLLYDFFRRKTEEAAYKKYLHLLRWARYANGTKVMEAMGGVLTERLSAIVAEHSDALRRIERLSVVLEDLSDHLADDQGTVLLCPYDGTLPQKRQALLREAVRVSDIQQYLRWSVHHRATLREMHDFFRRVQWMPVRNPELAEPSLPAPGSALAQNPSAAPSDAEGISRTPSRVLPSDDAPRATFLTDGDAPVGGPSNAMPGALLSVPSMTSTPAPAGPLPAAGASREDADIPASSAAAAMEAAQQHAALSLSNGEIPDACPVYVTEFEAIRPRLHHLGRLFRLEINFNDFGSQIELFYFVTRRFAAVFRQQAADRAYPVYDAAVAVSRAAVNVDINSNTTHVKEASWLTSCPLKEELDAEHEMGRSWVRQGTVREYDELLKAHAALLLNDDQSYVQLRLREHAENALRLPELHPTAAAGEPRTAPGMPDTSDAMWRSVYSEAAAGQGLGTGQAPTAGGASNAGAGRGRGDVGGGTERVEKDPLMGLVFLQYMRTRDLQQRVRDSLNYLRSVERTLAIDCSGGFAHAHAGTKSGGTKSQKIGGETITLGDDAGGDPEGHPALHADSPSDFAMSAQDVLGLQQIENRDDFYSVEDGRVRVRDSRGVYVMYDAALRDFQAVEQELLAICAHYVDHAAVVPREGLLGASMNVSLAESARLRASMKSNGPHDVDIAAYGRQRIDRAAMLLDAWGFEFEYQAEKGRLIDAYMQLYDNVFDPQERRRIAQIVYNIAHRRPGFDPQAPYFAAAYIAETDVLRLHREMIVEAANRIIDGERIAIRRVHENADALERQERERQRADPQQANAPPAVLARHGLPDRVPSQFPLRLRPTSTGMREEYLFEFHPALAALARIPTLLAAVCADFSRMSNPSTVTERLALTRRVWSVALSELRVLTVAPLVAAAPPPSYFAQALAVASSLASKSGIASASRDSFDKDKAPEPPETPSSPPPLKLGPGALKSPSTRGRTAMAPPVLVAGTPQERMRNVRASLLPEDPLAASLVAAHAAEIQNASVGGNRDFHAGGWEEFGEHVSDAEDCSAPRIKAWMVAVEALDQRQRLLDALDESELLERVYKSHAKAMGKAHGRACMVTLEYETPGSCLTEKLRELEREGLSQAPPRPAMVTSGDTSERPRDLAVCEIDEELGSGIDFTSVDGLQRLYSDAGAERLRLAVAAQVAHKNALVAAVLFHVDAISVYTSGLPARLAASSNMPAMSLGDSMIAGGPAISIAGADPALSSTQGLAPEHNRRLSRAFVGIQARKAEARSHVFLWFAREYKRGCAISGGEDVFPESTDAFMRARRAALVAKYTQALAGDMSSYSMRVQLGRHLHCLKTLLRRFPLRDAHFGFSLEDADMLVAHGSGGTGTAPQTAAVDVGEDESKFFRGLSRVSRRPLQLLSDDGTRVVNPWYVPSHREALEMFDAEPPTNQAASLSSCIEIVSAMHDVFAFLYMHARFSLAGSDAVIPMHAAEGIAGELQKIMTQLDKLPDASRPASVVSFLGRLRDAYLLEFELAVRYRIPETFLAGDHAAALRVLERNYGHGVFDIFRAGAGESVYATHEGLPQLEDRTGGQNCMRQMFPHRHLCARAGPLPGSMPPWHLIHRRLELTLLHLSDHDKSYAHGEVLGVRLQLEDFLQEHGVVATDQPLESLSLARRFLAAFLRLERLKRYWAREYLGLSQIDTWQVYSEYARGFQQLLGSAQKYYGLASPEEFAEMLRASGRTVRGVVPTSAASVGGGDHDPRSPAIALQRQSTRTGLMSVSKDSMGAGVAKAAAVLGEAGARLYALCVLRDALECHMVRRTRMSVARAHALLLTELARATAREFGAETEESETLADILHSSLARLAFAATSGSAGAAAAASGSAEGAVAVSGAHGAVAEGEDRRASVESRVSLSSVCGKGSVGMSEVESVFRQLGTELMHHERKRLRSLEDAWQRRLHHANHMLYLREQEIAALRAAATEDESNRRLLARTQLAGEAMDLVMEVTALRAKVKELSDSQRSHEAMVREALRKDYEDLVNSLAAVTFAIKSHFHEYRCALYDDIIEALADVRKETLERTIRSSSRRTDAEKEAEVARVIEQEDTMAETIQENSGLWSIVLKMKVMQEFKGIGLRASYEKRLRNLQNEVAQTKRRLLDEQMEAKQLQRSMAQQNNALLKQLGACEAKLLQADEQTQAARKELQSLSAWRAAKAKELQALEQRAKRSDKFRNVNVDELLRDLEEKDGLLKELTDVEARQVRQTQFDSGKAEKTIRQLEKALRHETEMKRQAFETIDRLQAQAERLQADLDTAEAGTGYLRTRRDLLGSSASLDGTSGYGIRRPPPSLEAHQRALENAAHSISGSYGNIVARLGASSRGSSPRADSPMSGRHSPPRHDSTSPHGDLQQGGPSASSALRLMWQLEGAGTSGAATGARPGRPITAPAHRHSAPSIPALPSATRRPQSGTVPLSQGTVRPGSSVTRIGSAGRDKKPVLTPGRMTVGTE